MVVLTSLGPPAEGVRHKEESTNVYFNSRSLGRGTLYISEARVSWVADVAGRGFSLEYPHIALHAVSKDLTNFHSECLYLMIDVRFFDSEGTPTPESSDMDNEDEIDEDTGMTEVRFVPEDKTHLDSMFQAMSDCQALHPDPEDNDSPNEEEDEHGDEGGGDEEDDDSDGMYDDAEDEEGEYDVATAEENAEKARAARNNANGNGAGGGDQEPMEDQ